MADSQLANLTALANASAADLMYIESGGTPYRMAFSNVTGSVLSSISVFNAVAYGADSTGVADSTTALQAAINAAVAAQGILFIPPGKYKITSGLTAGDGSVSGQATKHGWSIIGAGMGFDSVEATAPVVAGTELQWFGAAGGTMLTVNGPVAGIKISDLYFNCKASTNAAASAILWTHPFNSTFERLLARQYSGAAFTLTAISNAAGVATGANNNVFCQIRPESGRGSGSKGFVVGASTIGSSPFLGCSKNTFIDCEGNIGTIAGMTGFEVRFCDNLTFINTVSLGANLVGMQVTVPSGSSVFPSAITFVHCALAGVTVSGTWAPTERITFYGFAVGDSEAIPSHPGFAVISTDNIMYGTWGRTGIVRTSGSATWANFTPPADTGLTASAEVLCYDFAAATVQRLAGAVATQRHALFRAPTYSFASGSNQITDAATVNVVGAPIAGANCSGITYPWAFRAESGASQFPLIYGGTGAGASLSLQATANASPASAYIFLNTKVGGTFPGAVAIGAPASRLVAGANLQIEQGDAAGGLIVFVSYGAGTAANNFSGYAAAGTAASPTKTLATHRLIAYGGRGYEQVTPGFASGNNALFGLFAVEDFTNAAQGSYATVETTPTGSTTRREIARFGPNGVFNGFKGADVASAATITPTGNVFHVTGTTGITAISTTNIQAGTILSIIFDASLTVSNGASLKLSGAANFSATADDVLTVVYDGSVWREVSRSVN